VLAEIIAGLATRIGLADDPIFRRQIGDGVLAALGATPSPGMTEDEVRDRLATMVRLSAGPEPNLWRVSAGAASPLLARRLAEAASRLLIERRDIALRVARADRVDRLARAERGEVAAKAAFREVDANLGNAASAAPQVTAQLDAAVAARNAAEHMVAALEPLLRDGRGDFLLAPTQTGLPADIAAAAERLRSLHQSRIELAQTLLDRHPAMLRNAEEIGAARRDLIARARSASAAARAALADARRREQAAERAAASAQRSEEARTVLVQRKQVLEREMAESATERAEAVRVAAEAERWRLEAEGGAAIRSIRVTGRNGVQSAAAAVGLVILLGCGMLVLFERRSTGAEVEIVGPEPTAPPPALAARAAGAVAVLAGLALLGVAAPRLDAAIRDIPGDEIIARIRHGESVTGAELDRIARSRAAALDVVTTPGRRADLAIALLARAQALEGAERMAVVEIARNELARSLVAAPARPAAWMHLAAAEFALHGGTPLAANAVARSIETGPHERDIALPRLDLALAIRDALTPGAAAALPEQARFAVALDAPAATEMLRRHGAEDLR